MSETPHSSIHIVQQNCRTSRDVSLSLINDIDPANCDILLVQEPYIHPNTHLSIASPKWHAYYPIQPPTEDNPPCSFILVNANIDPSQVKQIPVPSTLVTAIAISSNLDPLCIFNIYNPPNTDLALDDLESWYHTTPLCCNIIWARDFNKHHPLWSGHTV